MKKIVIERYEIEYCNSMCPHFYHNYEKMEDIFCIKLDKKIFDFDIKDNVFMDTTERAFPNECPLEKA